MKTIKVFIASISVLFFFIQCSKDSDDIGVDEDISSDYGVYSAILNQGYDRIKKPLVAKQTSNLKRYLDYDENVYDDRLSQEGIGEEVFNDLVAKNDTIYELENKFNIFPRKVTLIANFDLEAVFLAEGVENGWDEFYKKYPDSGGYIRFSAQ